MNDVFTVIFKEREPQEDFENMGHMFNKETMQLKVLNIATGTYEVKRVEGSEECWELAMHKYLSLSKEVRKSASGVKTYPVIFTMLRLIPERRNAV